MLFILETIHWPFIYLQNDVTLKQNPFSNKPYEKILISFYV